MVICNTIIVWYSGKPADMWSTGVITYILLGGYPPFHDDKDQASLFRKIRKGIYEFHADYWDHVSEEAMDLIRGLLTVDMHKRLTVEQALQHSWVKSYLDYISEFLNELN